jgi:transposase
MSQRRTYNAEFKQHAVGLARQDGQTISGVADDLGIGRTTLQKWVRAAAQHGPLAFPGQGNARLTPEQEEIKRLKRENEVLRQEREILKSAAVWFAKHTK